MTSLSIININNSFEIVKLELLLKNPLSQNTLNYIFQGMSIPLRTSAKFLSLLTLKFNWIGGQGRILLYLCCPSEWVSDPSPQQTLLISICSQIFETSPEMEFSSEYITEMLLSYIFGPSVVKYDILSNNRCSKLHPVINCLFFIKYFAAVTTHFYTLKSYILYSHQFRIFLQEKALTK